MNFDREAGLVSIVMPVYNASQYVGQAVDSCLRQTYRNFEILAVDDASTDNSHEVLQSLSDARLRVFRNETNRGPGATRNVALHNSRGEWITVLDADDCYLDERLALLLDVAEHHGPRAMYTDDWLDWQLASPPPRHVEDFPGRSHTIRTWSPQEWLARSREARPFFHSSLLDSLATWYPEDLPAAQDTVFASQLLFLHDVPLHQLMAKTYVYRNTPGSITTSSLMRSTYVAEAYRRIAQVVPPRVRNVAQQLVDQAEMEINRKRIRIAIMSWNLPGALALSIRHPRACLSLFTQAPKYIAQRYRKYRIRQRQLQGGRQPAPDAS